MEKINEIANALFNEMTQQGTEFYLFRDGNYGTRQEGSFSEYEEEVIFTIPLSLEYWRDTLQEWELLDTDGRIKDDLTDEKKDDFICDVIFPKIEELEDLLEEDEENEQ